MRKNLNKQESIDISELKKKIIGNTLGVIPDEKFNQYRLTRGVYGQRQTGSQMIRIKIPFGKLSSDQLLKIADVSDKYADGVSHITTRQNIQYHFVKLKNAPKVWEELSDSGLTLREACGNTVRNITASASAGIDPNEPFDVSPYGQAVFEYFLRNPICQEMGRKIKIAFSSYEMDSAFTYFNDIGFIPKLNEKKERGFKVVLGGGLGAQSIVAKPIYEFLAENKIIPFVEAVLRVFDRYGERKNRYKARLKFLIKKIGLSDFMKLVYNEMKANKNKTYKIDIKVIEIDYYRENESLFIQPQTIIPLPVSQFSTTGSIKTGDGLKLWLEDGRNWHLEKRCSPKTKELFLKLNEIILDNLEVDGPRWGQKYYVAYRVSNTNWLSVETKSTMLRLTILVKSDTFNIDSIAKDLSMEIFDKDDPLADKLGLPSSVFLYKHNEDTDIIHLRIKDDFDLSSDTFSSFLLNAYESYLEK